MEEASVNVQSKPAIRLEIFPATLREIKDPILIDGQQVGQQSLTRLKVRRFARTVSSREPRQAPLRMMQPSVLNTLRETAHPGFLLDSGPFSRNSSIPSKSFCSA